MSSLQTLQDTFDLDKGPVKTEALEKIGRFSLLNAYWTNVGTPPTPNMYLRYSGARQLFAEGNYGVALLVIDPLITEYEELITQSLTFRKVPRPF